MVDSDSASDSLHFLPFPLNGNFSSSPTARIHLLKSGSPRFVNLLFCLLLSSFVCEFFIKVTHLPTYFRRNWDRTRTRYHYITYLLLLCCVNDVVLAANRPKEQ